MTQAARLADPIGHSPTMNWLVRGAIIGAAIGLGAVAIVGTGGLAAVAVVGGLVAGGAGIGEMLSTMSFAAKEVSGAIIGPGSTNVFTNGRPAARAHLDMTMCARHAPAPLPIATGSATVFINGQPAARVDDTIACSAVITSGSGTVFIGGAKQQTDQISPEDLVPPLVHAAILVVGLGAAVVLAGPVVAVAGLVLGTAGGIGGNWAGGKIFGEGSDGQKWSALGGGLVGGLLGGKGGSFLAGKFVPRPVTPLAGFVKGGLPGVDAVGASEALAEPAYGVTFFGDDILPFYGPTKATVGNPNGSPSFFMSLEDAAQVKNAHDAAVLTGMAPSAKKAYLTGGDINGFSFPIDGLRVTRPTAVDAGGWPHFLEGGYTAVKLEGPNAGYLVNPVKEYITPGDSPVPSGSVLFKVGPNGEWIPLRSW